MSSVQVEAIGTDSKDIPFQAASLDIWDKKYRLKSKTGAVIDETMDDTYKRVAQALSDVEESQEKKEQWNQSFLWALRRGAIPAGRITSNAGAQQHKPATSTINCTVSGTIRDSMDGILEKVHEAGLTLKAGCGIGYEFSTLRPKRRLRVRCRRLYLRPAQSSWISTTRCVSPSPRPAAAAAPRWRPSRLATRMRWTSFARNAKTAGCGSSTAHCWLLTNS